MLKSPPDGYTLLFAGPNSTIGASLYKKLAFNFQRDSAPVAFVMHFPNLMVVSPSLPVQSVKEFIEYARTYPGEAFVCVFRARNVVASVRCDVRSYDQH